MVTQPQIHGDVDDRFGRVADVFRDNFTSGGEVGAAVTVYVRGRKVVDLYGGSADTRTGRPWDAHTPVVVFSCTKGILAICAYLLAQQGRLDLDAPVTRYWPEFGQHGKARHPGALAAHPPGRSARVRPPADPRRGPGVGSGHQGDRGAGPAVGPGTAHGYHPMTYGWLVGEVIHRITGQLPGAFFPDTLAEPLGLRTWLGLPAAESDTVAWGLAPPPDPDPFEDPVAERGITMGGAFAFPADADGLVSFNDDAIRAAGVPGAGAVSTADGLARLYAAVRLRPSGGPLLTAASVDDAVVVRSRGQQRHGPPDTGQRWGTGFLLHSPPARPMLGERSFGHDGAGGNLAFADAEHQVGFGYVVNQMRGMGDERANRLTAAVRSCLTT